MNKLKDLTQTAVALAVHLAFVASLAIGYGHSLAVFAGISS